MIKKKQKLMILFIILAVIVMHCHSILDITFAENNREEINSHNDEHPIEEEISKQNLTTELNNEEQNSPISLMSEIIGGFEIEKDTATNQASIVKYRGSEENIIIPETIDGYKVISIKERAFYTNYKLISIDIPDSVESIGLRAFYMCSNLSSVKIGKSVKSIGEYAFFECNSLTALDIPDSVESMGISVFSRCKNLASLKIGNSLRSIGDGVFFGCDLLTAVDIPDSVESIGTNAFFSCENLASVKIGDSVRSIEYQAFFANKSLISLVIPDSVETIGKKAFTACTNLSSVKIGDSVKSIGDSAFSKCESLIKVDIPDSVESVENSAFAGCGSLSSVKIGKLVKSIGDYAFYDCTSLTSVVLPNTLTSLAGTAFSDSSVNNLIFICQDINDMNISVIDSIPEGVHVYRIAKDIKAAVKEIVSYEYIGNLLLLDELFKIESLIYDGTTSTNQYEGSEIKLADYFDVSVIYTLVGDKTSNDTKIIDNQFYIGEDETSDSLSIKMTNETMSIEVPIQIIKAKSLSIKEEPQNTYDETHHYNPEGLVLTMTYEDGYEKDIEYRDDNDEITFKYNVLDLDTVEQVIQYKGFEVKQPLTIYGYQILIENETKIEVAGMLTHNSLLKIEKIKDADAIIYNNLNHKELIVGYDVQIIGEYKDKLTIAFDVGHKNNGKKVYIRHLKHDGSLEEFEETVNEGKIDIEVTELSPFLIYKDEERVEEPDNNKPDIDIDHHVPSEPVPEIPVITPDKPVSDIPVIRPIGGENISDKEIWTIQESMIPTGDNQAILLWGIIAMTSIATMISIHKKYRL